ncbi:hypothetical protein CANARDRAFT_202015 [[Candida] arabinofermentans NRRL YB-2248]|uniref:DNA mismatch repair protein HSM3 N-terminal domain-containing protein n=1 Tax=[Candida] arabinofermentans NRRL YB-2248 TaxID=983967 RepID=A0A1E4SX62_9ASCO|nr:hypothetical protein CANARDRAFT_202015 [[Candida] arabinofermentans NRRL YB-2248]
MDELLGNPDLQTELNHRLFEDCEVKLREEESLYDNGNQTMLVSFGPLVMKIVRSDMTTKESKNNSIEILSAVLKHYMFEEILQLFGLDVLSQGLESSNEKLRTTIIDVIATADPPDLVANTPLILKIVDTLKDTESTGTALHASNCLQSLASKGVLIRRRLMSSEIMRVFEQMRLNDRVSPRLFDLITGLLEVMPTIPQSFIFMENEELKKVDDPLFVSYMIAHYSDLLDLRSDILNQIEMDEPIKFALHTYLDEAFMIDVKEYVVKDAGLFLAKLSVILPKKFEELNSQYDIINYSFHNCLLKTECAAFLETFDVHHLVTIHDHLKGIPLNSKTFGIYLNILRNESLIDQLSLPSIDISRLDAYTFLQLVYSLSTSDHGVDVLVLKWPSLIERFLAITPDIRDRELEVYIENVLDNLVLRRAKLGLFYAEIMEQYKSFPTRHKAQPQVDVMDATA